ncbi:MFS transporter [Actinosynnema mirum]|uniref:Putative tartrate transporter n=1 Tax=Actinosynnema mirum (strain ATCC 29888 / DSM 43827 / JCM 3225 / NBRC 14064 / NCIMB 13271 / NRRL B-12336 / IMRU 3971 / 101) TaxID=446462 RepID=C6WMQ2_ACTMD|nr:MFS transporter [Actinosynnema mirum]ACU36581.1 major facilitator superfamily MFS_1 [Actinosynnema mirum DSM 43827]AXX30033.1 Nitrate/nitrite transporter [Actinosynnema pretiosum subsp. pretiosum]
MDTSTATGATPVTAVEKSAIRKVAMRLVPFVALMFFINYLDRTAIGFAAPNGMNSDLALTAAQFGFASGIFFLGYIVLEVPSNIALHKFGARRWLARIMVTWGIVAVLFTWVQNYTQLATLRFLLGVAEAGFFPGAVLFLSLWVPVRYRTRILALFYLAQPLTTVVGAPLAGWLIQQHDVFFGLEGWRFMFLGVGAPAIIVGVIAWFYLADSPKDAKWLTKEEQDWLTTALSKEDAGKGPQKHHGLKAAFGSGRVWMLSLIYFGFIYGLYTLAFFLPTIISGFQESAGVTFGLIERGLITAIPYVPAAIVLYLWSRDATKRGVKTWHISIPAVVGAVSIPLALYAGSPAATIAVITVTACAIFAALPNFWSVPTQFLSGAAAAAGVALINTVGNIAGFAAPYITGAIHDATGAYTVPMFVVGGFMLLSAILMVVLDRRGRTATTAAPLEEKSA